MHVATENDCGPHVVILPRKTWKPQFTFLDTVAIYWYHSYMHRKTNEHVTKCATGFIIVRDDNDSKSETYKAFNTVCPVSGMDVKASVRTVSFNGKDYGFCCAGCVEKFSADPEKFGKQLNEDGTTLLKN